jgi:hypothetical protein
MRISSRQREELLNQYITAKSKAHELVEKLGIIDDSEKKGKARPKFKHEGVNELYQQTTRVVKRLSLTSPQELLSQAKQPDFLQQDLDKILSGLGEKVWGRNTSRDHLYDRELYSNGKCDDRDLWWDDEGDRELCVF